MSCRASAAQRDSDQGRRLVRVHREAYPSEWAAITAVSKQLEMNAETLRTWIRQQVDGGDRDGRG